LCNKYKGVHNETKSEEKTSQAFANAQSCKWPFKQPLFIGDAIFPNISYKELYIFKAGSIKTSPMSKNNFGSECVNVYKVRNFSSN
jgi:hypothetical protein